MSDEVEEAAEDSPRESGSELSELRDQVAELRAQIESQNQDLESRLVAQEHRGFAALLNFFRAFSRRKPEEGETTSLFRRRRVSAITGLATAFRPTPTRIMVLGGSILTFLTLLVAVSANQILQQQNRQMMVTNDLAEAQRRAALMFEFTSVLEQVTQAAEEEFLISGNPEQEIEISPILHGRIAGLSAALKPYRYLRDDSPPAESAWWQDLWGWCGQRLWCDEEMPAWWSSPMEFFSPRPLPDMRIVKPLSPERGQLAVTLVRSRVAMSWDPINLENADLRGQNLEGANLRGANLSYANLSRANLTRADLRGAYLRNANLSRTQLHHAHLDNANLGGANLRGAGLVEANLGGASLSRADLEAAGLVGASLSEASLILANLYGANLEGVDLTNADLIHALSLNQEMLDAACASSSAPPRLPPGLNPPPQCE